MSKQVTVIVPCFNQGRYLNECLQSVSDQSYFDWECIIVNDGSTDETEKISDAWLQKDDRFRYLFQENKGLPAARNLGIKNATGDFILPLDADDKIGTEYLTMAISRFEKDNLVKIVYCKAEKFGLESGPLHLKSFSLYELALNNMIFCTALFKRDDWQRVNGYDESLTNGWEDWEFWISVLKNGGRVIKLDYLGFFYRTKTSSLLKKMNTEVENSILRYLSIKHASFYVDQFGSFVQLEKKIIALEKENECSKILNKSNRYITDLFLQKFFGFQIFGTLRN